MLTAEALRTIQDATAAVRAQLATARMARQSAFAAAGSRLFVGLMLVATVWGVTGDLSRSNPTTVTNVATKTDVDCVRSDLAVYLTGAPPNTLCGPPPSGATVGRK